ncbi:MAG: MarR family transcriptional regulator [Actinomycetota bacterium]|nr:MarR family transcriptional regulator [Actinomycetota bacterium]
MVADARTERSAARVPAEPDPNQDLAAELLGAIAAVRRSLHRRSGLSGMLRGLTGSQLELVRLLRRQPGLSVAGAAAELRLAPNTVSTLVHQLCQLGVVAREEDLADRRVTHLRLVAEASSLLAEHHDQRVLALAEAASRLSAKEREGLQRARVLMDRLACVLCEDRAPPGRPEPAGGRSARGAGR